MSLGLQSGDLDWRALEESMPAGIFEGWRAYHAKNPQGTGHFYKFLGHAFSLLAKAHHDIELAGNLRWTNFCWWEEDDSEKDDGMSDEDMERYFDRYQHLGK